MKLREYELISGVYCDSTSMDYDRTVTHREKVKRSKEKREMFKREEAIFSIQSIRQQHHFELVVHRRNQQPELASSSASSSFPCLATCVC